MAKVFISYRRGDSAGHTGRLFDSLEERFGREAFFRDIDNLEPGVDFPAALNRALSECDAMLVMIGPSWASATGEEGRRLEQEGDYVRIEVANALARKSVRVIPVLVGGATMPPTEELPEDLQALRRRNAFEISDTRWDYDVSRLGDTLAKHLDLTEAEDAAPEKRRVGLFGLLGIGLGAVIVLVLALQFLTGLRQAPDSNDEPEAEAPIRVTEVAVSAADSSASPTPAASNTPPPLPADTSPPLDTFVVGGLTWTTDDRKARVDWNAAAAYCESLTAEESSNWRLPTIEELESISDPDDPDAFDKYILRPFHDGVTSNWIWSSEMDTAGSAFAFDFSDLATVSLALNFDEGAHGLCVSD